MAPHSMTSHPSLDSNHPITPPPELVKQWASESLSTQRLCTNAARWGADQELEACCEWLFHDWIAIGTVNKLRAARRPEPKSQAEEAIAELDGIATCFLTGFGGDLKCDTIRAALERLRELEGGND